MDKVRLGVVGLGSRGTHLARTAVEVSGGRMAVVACVEPSDENFTRAVEASGSQPERHADVKQMIYHANLDGILICTPNHLHLEHLQALHGTSLAVLLEKPLESDLDEIRQVVDFTARHRGPVLVGHCMRFAPILEAAKSILDSGELGQVCSARFVQNCHYGNRIFNNWRREGRLSGTQFIEKATHDFDIMLWLLQKRPVSVMAVSRLHAFGGDKPPDLRCRNCEDLIRCPESTLNIALRSGVSDGSATEDDLCAFSNNTTTPDNEAALIQFEDGVFATYHHWYFSPRSYHHRVYEIHGRRGAMEIDLGDEHGGKITFSPRFGGPGDKHIHSFDYLGRCHYNGDGPMLSHFLDVIRSEAEPRATVEQAFMAEWIGYGAILSSRENALIDLSDSSLLQPHGSTHPQRFPNTSPGQPAGVKTPQPLNQ